METLTEQALLAAWECSASLTSNRRAVALLSQWANLPVDEADALALGVRDRMLLDLREQCFGTVVECLVTCESCADELEVEVALDELRSSEPVLDSLTVDVDGRAVELRPLTSADLVASDGTRLDLLARCIVDGDLTLPGIEDAVERALDMIDPQAAMTIELQCPSCGARWSVPFDVASFVCDEVEHCARRLLRDVHILAAAYGWREADVLAVSPVRRRYYLEACAR